MNISKIIDCDATNCLYNKEKQCHTYAINIGDDLPVCDTFMNTSNKGGFDRVSAGVGSCKVRSCSHNTSYECSCDGIHMHIVGDHVDCMSYNNK